MPINGLAEDAIINKLVERQPGLAYLLGLMNLLQSESTLTAMPYYLRVK
jgi:hypothetical protein